MFMQISTNKTACAREYVAWFQRRERSPWGNQERLVARVAFQLVLEKQARFRKTDMRGENDQNDRHLGTGRLLKQPMGPYYPKLAQLLVTEMLLTKKDPRQLRVQTYIWIVLGPHRSRNILCVKGVYTGKAAYANLLLEIKCN